VKYKSDICEKYIFEHNECKQNILSYIVSLARQCEKKSCNKLRLCYDAEVVQESCMWYICTRRTQYIQCCWSNVNSRPLCGLYWWKYLVHSTAALQMCCSHTATQC